MKVIYKKILSSMTNDVIKFFITLHHKPWYHMIWSLLILAYGCGGMVGKPIMDADNFGNYVGGSIILFQLTHIGIAFLIEYSVKWYKMTKDKMEKLT